MQFICIDISGKNNPKLKFADPSDNISYADLYTKLRVDGPLRRVRAYCVCAVYEAVRRTRNRYKFIYYVDSLFVAQ
jgi:hypothetical protein